jgi:deoxyribose-phosphate aldolase
MKENKFALTESGYTCVNPACVRPLYLELDGDRIEACVTCDPPRGGLPTAFRMMGVRTARDVMAFVHVADPLCGAACCRRLDDR